MDFSLSGLVLGGGDMSRCQCYKTFFSSLILWENKLDRLFVARIFMQDT